MVYNLLNDIIRILIVVLIFIPMTFSRNSFDFNLTSVFFISIKKISQNIDHINLEIHINDKIIFSKIFKQTYHF